ENRVDGDLRDVGAPVWEDEAEHAAAHLRRRVERILARELVPPLEALRAAGLVQDPASERLVVDEDARDANPLRPFVLVAVSVVVATELVFRHACRGFALDDRIADGATARLTQPAMDAWHVGELLLLRVLGQEKLGHEDGIDEVTADVRIGGAVAAPL